VLKLSIECDYKQLFYGRGIIVESVYKIVEIIGTSDKSWEEAAKVAVNTASKSLRDLRVAEVKELDMKIEEGGLIFRVKMNLSFKYQD